MGPYEALIAAANEPKVCGLQEPESAQAAAAQLLPAAQACLDAAMAAVATHSAGLELPATCGLLPAAMHAAASAAKVSHALQTPTLAAPAYHKDTGAICPVQQLLQCCDLLGSAARLPWVLYHGGKEPPNWPKPEGAER
ncbi:hypothetical protein N2152v2_010868 [Parachlorella kessleri]